MRWLIGIVLALLCAGAARADDAPKVHARLVAEHDAVAPGGTVTIAFEQIIRPGWHTYWLNPGDVGQPTTLTWSMPPGWKTGPLQWPYPKRLPVGPYMDFGYEGKAWILDTLTAPSDAKPGDTVTLTAAATWLVCREICIPEDATLRVPIKIGTPSQNADMARAFGDARARLPVPSPWPARYQTGPTLDLYLAAKPLTQATPSDATFFPLSGGLVKGTPRQTLGIAPDGIVLGLKPGKKLAQLHGPLEGVLVLTSRDGSTRALSISAPGGPVPPAIFISADNTADGGDGTTLPLAILFAFVGGLILNLMPCVLPILAMKTLSLASLAGRGRREAVHESLAYGAGAVLSFVALGGLLVALRAGGAAIGWGFQLQDPLIVAIFAVLMFGVGLNLSGVYELSAFGGGENLTRAGGLPASFFTGILAVAVAAPCTAPFMAAALGYALTQPAVTALAIFLALGLGFALPFVLAGLAPGLLRVLPRPGPWMLWLKQVLAFAMYGTAVWLVWVLANQSGPNAVAAVLAAMIAVGFGAWAWGVTRPLSPRARGIGALLAVIGTVIAFSCLALIRDSAPAAAATRVEATGLPSEPYSAARLADLRAHGRPVFINATAAWCITCLVNDEAALSSARVRDVFAAKHVAYLVADWTRRNPAITELLAQHHRSGVPLYLYFPPGAGPPAVLPQILTESAVLSIIAHQSKEN